MTNNIIFLAVLSVLFIACAYLSQYVQKTNFLEKLGVIIIVAFMFGLFNLLNHI